MMSNDAAVLSPCEADVEEVEVIDDARDGASWSGVTLRATGTRASLFLVHDGTGDNAWFARLAAHVDADVPVHGLPAAAAGTPQPLTIEAMATRLISVMHGVQPRGPFRIAGAGLGGVLAYEMAVQLVGQDQAVEFVGLIGTDFPGWPAGHPGDAHPHATLPHRHRRAVANYAIQPMPLDLHLFVSAGDVPAAPPAGSAAGVAPQGWASLVPRLQVWRGDEAGDGLAGMGRALSRALSAAAGRQAPLPERRHGAHVVIQSGKRGDTPVLCVPGAGDSVIGFIPLSDALGADVPLHGLQPRGVEGLLVPHATVEAAAAFYLEATQAQRRGGPVHLVGHSFGGWIAFEMALQLRALGQPVASLTLIDSEAPDGIGVLGSEYTSTGALVELIRVMEMSAGKPLGIAIADFKRCGRGDQLRLLHEGMVRIGLLPKRSDPSAVRGLTRTFGTALRTTYRPRQVYGEPVGLVLARDPNEDDAHNASAQSGMMDGWKRFAPDLVAWNAPGDHFSILRQPHVRALAEWWRASAGRPRVRAQAELSRVN